MIDLRQMPRMTINWGVVVRAGEAGILDGKAWSSTVTFTRPVRRGQFAGRFGRADDDRGDTSCVGAARSQSGRQLADPGPGGSLGVAVREQEFSLPLVRAGNQSGAAPDPRRYHRGGVEILEPPWPDLIITAGWRNEPVARWIRGQAAAEGQRVRITHLGRTWARIEHFDLIITTLQYRLPVRSNVLHNKTPLHRITAERLVTDARRWRSCLDHLPAPFITVVIGGSSGPYSFDRAAATCLARQASAQAAARGGSLLVTTSSRTPAAAVDAFCADVSGPVYIHRWSRGGSDNPYFAFLSSAARSS